MTGKIPLSTTCELFPATLTCDYPLFSKKSINGPVKHSSVSGICHFTDNIRTSKMIFGLWLVIALSALIQIVKIYKRTLQFIPCLQRHKLRSKLYAIILRIDHFNLDLDLACTYVL